MTPVMDPKQVAATNPAVDPKKIEQAVAIRQAMEKAGVFRKAEYRLSPPLGDGSARSSRNAPAVVRMIRS